jgi:anti-anti-sigma regulatory factor
MEPHLTSSSTTTGHVRNQDRTAEVLAYPGSIGERDVGSSRVRAVPAQAHLTLVSAPVWRHKLILTGSLDDRTAVELEEEIECLCEEGVTILTLDLRQLDAIDAAGAKAIALRGAVCEGRGRNFAVIPGSPVVHRVLAEAGAESLLAGDPGESAADGSPRDTSTAMIKNL